MRSLINAKGDISWDLINSENEDKLAKALGMLEGKTFIGLKKEELPKTEYTGTIKDIIGLIKEFRTEYASSSSYSSNDGEYLCIIRLYKDKIPLYEIGYWKNGVGGFKKIPPNIDPEGISYKNFSILWKMAEYLPQEEEIIPVSTITEQEYQIFMTLYKRALASLCVTVYSVEDNNEI